MDFSFTPEQDDLRTLARRIATDHTDIERVKATLDAPDATDLEQWRTMATAGLAGIGLPEAVGGGGYGWLETTIALEELGRAAALVPGLAVMALAGPALAEHPDLLAGVADGSVIVTAAIHEPLGDPFRPSATFSDGGLRGTKVCVAHGLLATRFVVTAADGLYCVESDAPGVTVVRQDTTSGVPDALVTFEGAPAQRIGGTAAVDALLDRAISAACVMVSGACQAALALTAEYTKGREQFERRIASFQAVSQRAGDAYIDTEAVRLTAWQAAWRLAEGQSCANELLTAKFWAAEGGWRVMHAAHHLHGGMGVDRDYPLHRYFLLHKQLELLFGSATPSLQRLGKLLTD